jgi:ketosteroid isomerase-like protein
VTNDRVQVLERVFRSWAQGDFGATVDLMASDIVTTWDEPPSEIVARGRDEAMARFRDLLRQWRQFRAEAEEFVVLDDDTVLVVAHQRAFGRLSGVETQARVYIVCRFRDDKLAATHWHFDRERALAAAGLSPG